MENEMTDKMAKEPYSAEKKKSRNKSRRFQIICSEIY